MENIWVKFTESPPHSKLVLNVDRNGSVLEGRSPQQQNHVNVAFGDFLNCHQSIQIVAQSLETHKNNTLILEELRWFNLVNGSGNLPSLLQVGRKKKYMKLARENKGNLF